MVRNLCLLSLLLAAVSASSFRLWEITRRQPEERHAIRRAGPESLIDTEPEPLYEALVHLDGRHTEILIDSTTWETPMI